MPTTYSQSGVPALVSADSNTAALTLAIDDRLMGIPRATPGSSFVAAVITAWRNIAAPAGSVIDTVNRKVTSTDNATKIAAFVAAAGGATHNVTFTATTPSAASSMFTIDDVLELDAILGGDDGKGLFYASIDGNSMSLEGILNALVSKLGRNNKHALVAVDQAAGTITLGQFASDAAQTTSANTLRSAPPASPAVFVTHELAVAAATTPTSGPNFGL